VQPSPLHSLSQRVIFSSTIFSDIYAPYALDQFHHTLLLTILSSFSLSLAIPLTICSYMPPIGTGGTSWPIGIGPEQRVQRPSAKAEVLPWSPRTLNFGSVEENSSLAVCQYSLSSRNFLLGLRLLTVLGSIKSSEIMLDIST